MDGGCYWGSKMSKSEGQVVNPLDLIDAFGADAFRYFVISEMNVGKIVIFPKNYFRSATIQI